MLPDAKGQCLMSRASTLFSGLLTLMQPLLGLLDLAALVPQELLASAYIDLTNVFYSE
jgi:hypothetical protein